MFDIKRNFSSIFFFKQKTAYEMRISDWSSDVCSSDLLQHLLRGDAGGEARRLRDHLRLEGGDRGLPTVGQLAGDLVLEGGALLARLQAVLPGLAGAGAAAAGGTPAVQDSGREDRKSVVSGKSVS